MKTLMVKPEVLTLKSKTTWSIAARWLERCLNCCPFFNIFFFFWYLFYDVMSLTATVVKLHAKQSEVISDRTAGLAPLLPSYTSQFGPLDKSRMIHSNVQANTITIVWVLRDSLLDRVLQLLALSLKNIIIKSSCISGDCCHIKMSCPLHTYNISFITALFLLIYLVEDQYSLYIR